METSQLTKEEIDEAILLAAEAEADAKEALRINQLKVQYETAIQKRLDAFAYTRGYGDSRGNGALVSACSYALSDNPIRAAEAKYCIKIRDKTWDTYFAILKSLDEFPNNFSFIETLLPELAWPV